MGAAACMSYTFAESALDKAVAQASDSEEVSSNDRRFHKLYSKRIFEKANQKTAYGNTPIDIP